MYGAILWIWASIATPSLWLLFGTTSDKDGWVRERREDTYGKLMQIWGAYIVVYVEEGDELLKLDEPVKHVHGLILVMAKSVCQVSFWGAPKVADWDSWKLFWGCLCLKLSRISIVAVGVHHIDFTLIDFI